MPTAHARIASAQARKLLRTLCNHWRHKFELEYADDRARIVFDADTQLRAGADETGLALELIAADPARLHTLQGVVLEHLQRFAREETLAADWR
ncbi:DUF2218 domain-containing protein [Lysobacter sp. BMK333-48F3]|uniref:DUF2218 domain-containing protein n=1 Tax=Lysobacter sp. BMK333-48F3 TaxID=2867962 RepID=UPI001C8B6DEB|nr:DUF2218 domain-containing protein [Lysobacter sp. BMK333-48F3]MBX9400919.1 DUF2218 domain-containing protein [Lysobacter sp. BMK333-48F3]